MYRKNNIRKFNTIEDENVKTIKTECKYDKLEYLKKCQNKAINTSTT